MYICICNGITDKQIEEEVAAGASSLEELQMRLGVATGCGTCAYLASSYLPIESQGVEIPNAINLMEKGKAQGASI